MFGNAQKLLFDIVLSLRDQLALQSFLSVLCLKPVTVGEARSAMAPQVMLNLSGVMRCCFLS